MKLVNYSILGDKATIFLEGQAPIHLGKGDIRYPKIFPLLKKGGLTEEKAIELLDHKNSLDKDVAVKDVNLF